MYKGSDVKDNLVIVQKDIIPEVNKAMKYFLMLKAFKNIQKTDLGLLKTRHSYKKVNKNN